MPASSHDITLGNAVNSALESTESFKLEQAIGMNVNRTAFLMTEEISRRFNSHGYALSAQDFAILFRLQKQGPMTQVAIAAVTMRDKTTITRRINGLTKKGFVARNACQNDRRCFRIALTESGHQALAVMIPLVADFQQEMLNDISDEEKAITIKTLKHISETIIQNK